MKTIINYLSLYLTKGVGAKSVKNIIEIFGSVDNFFNSNTKTYHKLKEKIEKNLKQAEKILNYCQKQGIKIYVLEDKNYPLNLRGIPDPPPVLFVKGNLPKNNSISIVGTRNHSTYGKNAAISLTEFLANHSIQTVSGGALGIDTVVHRISLENNIPTCVVLGSGFNHIYPYENKKLFERIVENDGGIISEFLPDTKPSKFTFPKRNRIIAGLSLATIVVEAPEKSGSLITAELANQYGRQVFCVPHSIDNPKGKGCNLLIKEGATILTDINDLKEEMPYIFKEKLTNTQKQIPKAAEKILSLINNQLHIDELLAKSDLQVDELMEILLELELQGKIVNNNGFIEKRGI